MKKTSSYKKEDKKKVKRADKYKKSTKTKDFSHANTSKEDIKVKPNTTKDKTTFNPYYNKQARRYEITCFVCKEEKLVAIKPIEGIPVICDDCLVEIEARKLLDRGGVQKTKKLECKWCGKSFYALNESYLFCDECYDKFSHEIKARNRGLEKYNCDNCDAEVWLPHKTIKAKKEKELPILCRDCLKEEEEKQKRERRKNRIAKVKKRMKN